MTTHPFIHRRVRAIAAFTLVELLVVIGIIALLISILMPALQRARDAAMNVACMSNLRQHGIAIANYVVDHNNYFPSFNSTNGWEYMHYWNVMKETYLPIGNEVDTTTNQINLGLICPGWRAHFTGPNQGPAYQYNPDRSGYHQAVGNSRSRVQDDKYRYRFLGHFKITEVGSRLDEPNSVGPLRRTHPTRFMMLTDAGFTTASNVASMNTGDPIGHRSGWNALFVDGHVQHFTEPNFPGNDDPGVDYYRLRDGLDE